MGDDGTVRAVRWIGGLLQYTALHNTAVLLSNLFRIRRRYRRNNNNHNNKTVALCVWLCSL